ncbi:MAG: hypothetical protein K5891_10110 [Lachnospiraceae bacterium]|nr:hypothetical protein [Lachnospiraceae bacterium]
MTQDDRKMLTRINEYAEKVMPDIDPQKTPVSQQLEALRPIMETIASEQGTDLQDIFIRYMDLASEAAMDRDNKMRDALKDLNDGEDGNPPLLYR